MKKVSVDFKFECPLYQLPDLMKKLKKSKSICVGGDKMGFH